MAVIVKVSLCLACIKSTGCNQNTATARCLAPDVLANATATATCNSSSLPIQCFSPPNGAEGTVLSFFKLQTHRLDMA